MDSTTDATETAPTYNAPKTRLLPSLVLAVAAIAGALVFASSYKAAPPLTEIQATSAMPNAHAGHRHAHKDPAAEAGPQYFAGGLWSHRLGLTGLAEAAVNVIYPNQHVVIHSLAWDKDQLAVIDRTPITAKFSKPDTTADLVIVSIDHAGDDPPPAFAGAIQKHLESLRDDQNILIVTPLPGPDERGKNAFPYDWTFLQTSNEIDLLDWLEVEPAVDINSRPNSGYLRAWVEGSANLPDAHKQEDVQALLLDTSLAGFQARRVQVLWELGTRSPYEVVPALDPAGQLGVRYILGVHADDAIRTAATSDDPVLRALAARAIGDLAEVTTDPLSTLTRLAEDKDIVVRYEALVATRAMPGRRAAGVAQLAENMEMTDAMRALYDATMPMMLAFGEPVPADSRADRLRRMPMAELLAEERDALVCMILLGRADLPDTQIDPVLNQLAQVNGTGSLVALLKLLETMNPRFLREREVLLRKLVGWKTSELDAQQTRLVELAQTGRLAQLRSAAVGGMMRSAEPQAVLKQFNSDPVLFSGLRWVEDPVVLQRWSPITLDRALSAAGGEQAVQIAALDALQHLPDQAMTAQRIDSLMLLARNANELDLRFAAIRAVNALPPGKQPEGIDDLRLTRLTIQAVPGEIRFDKTTLTAVAGRPVELTLINPDAMAHNLAITKPGRGQTIGMAVTAMGSLAADTDYIPEGSPDVLHYTRMIGQGETDTLRFIAPKQPGNYDYVCTFPGHFTTMIGVFEVVEP